MVTDIRFYYYNIFIRKIFKLFNKTQNEILLEPSVFVKTKNRKMPAAKR